MCTVTFVFSNQQFIITSNRDEKTQRQTAAAPKSYLVNQKQVFFPKDPQAGGTWFAVDSNQNAVILLNGAIEKHLPKSNYRKSRGLIVLDLIGSPSPIICWKNIDLEDIEPFTIVLFENKQLYELKWDAKNKHTQPLSIHLHYVWSSVTLYGAEIRSKRANWFESFMTKHPQPSAENLIHFHKNTAPENMDYGLVINRNETMKTVSISQVVFDQNKTSVFYHDLLQDESFSTTFLSL